MEIELIKTIIVGMPVMLLVTAIYVYLLLGIAKIFNGLIKFIIGMVNYLAFSVVIVLPLFYLISSNQPAIKESTYTLVAVLFSYLIIMAPGLYYLGKIKLKQLQGAGYFLPRK